MKDVAIFGAGGFGREVACLIRIINEAEKEPKWNLIGFFDDNKNLHGTKNEYGTVLGGTEALNKWKSPLDVALAIGNPHAVRAVANNITNKNVSFPNIFAPSTIFLDENNIVFGKGNIVCSRCLFSCKVKVGDFNVFNSYITIGHDVVMGNYNSLMPGVRISGEITIGEENFFGCDSVVLQQLKIGNKTTIGANSTVVRKTKDGYTYVGNPAKRMDLI